MIAHADSFRLTFDENGNGSFQIFNPTTGQYGPPQNDPGMSVIDPTTVTGRALQYQLPEMVVAGDVGLGEPGVNCTAAAPALCSDGLRFLNIGGTGFMRFYSDRNDPDTSDLADTGLPSNFAPLAFANEVGLEGSNTFMYVAGSGDPANTNFYLGTSDVSVPEPATAVLVCIGLAGLVGYRSRRMKRKMGGQ